MAELDLTHGNLKGARQHAENALALGQEGQTFGHAEPLSRLGRILAAQGDLAGARQQEAEALSIAEAIGLVVLARKSKPRSRLWTWMKAAPPKRNHPSVPRWPYSVTKR